MGYLDDNFLAFCGVIVYFFCMKKPRSLKPAEDRMRKRVREARALPKEAQAAFYYCGGLGKAEFAAAVAAGESEPVELALNVVAGELWLCPRDGARYARSIRAALRKACEAGRLTESQKRTLFAIEMRNLERLVLRGRHSAPGMLQQRAERRIPGQLLLMKRCFGVVKVPGLEPDDLPDVVPPVMLLQKAGQRGWFSQESAERMAAADASLLGILVHAPGDVLPAACWLETKPSHAPETLCYFFCWRGFREARWVVAPWGELGNCCGFILAADGAFYCAVTEWDNFYGATC